MFGEKFVTLHPFSGMRDFIESPSFYFNNVKKTYDRKERSKDSSGRIVVW